MQPARALQQAARAPAAAGCRGGPRCQQRHESAVVPPRSGGPLAARLPPGKHFHTKCSHTPLLSAIAQHFSPRKASSPYPATICPPLDHAKPHQRSAAAMDSAAHILSTCVFHIWLADDGRHRPSQEHQLSLQNRVAGSRRRAAERVRQPRQRGRRRRRRRGVRHRAAPRWMPSATRRSSPRPRRTRTSRRRWRSSSTTGAVPPHAA